jgi:SET domain-containing protein
MARAKRMADGTPLHSVLPACGIRVGVSPTHGRGVFALVNYEKGALVEEAPVLLLPSRDQTEQTKAYYYVFAWSDVYDALALGFGSLYNHSATPNLEFAMDKRSELITFRARKRIVAGDELFINYGPSTLSKKKMEFWQHK